ncbi:MAG: excinuclease ABC subunit UvrA [Opitutales bacterium]
MASNNSPIQVFGARENNLKGIDLELFPGQLIVFTGLSGAGKSTLLFDVLHAEGQRKYVETFSPYVRQFLETLQRPKVDSIKNIRPSIAVEQKNTIRNSRSTIGTMTELCDYFKVWFSQAASFIDPDSGKILLHETPHSQASKLLNRKNSNVIIGFVATRPVNLPSKEFITFLIQAGHARGFHQKKYSHLEDIINSDWNEQEIFVVVDRVSSKKENKPRIIEAITLSIKHGHGLGQIRDKNGDILNLLYEGLRSPTSGQKYATANPSAFSFNSPVGACEKCKGFGRVIEIDRNLVVPDPSLSITEGTIKAFSGKIYGHCQSELIQACQQKGISINTPWKTLSKEEQNFIWLGDPGYQEGNQKWYGINVFFNWLEKKTYKMHVRVFLSKYRGYFNCPSCAGNRLKEESLHWKWKLSTLPELYRLPIDDLLKKISNYKLTGNPKSDLAIESIKARLSYLQDVGLGYLSLDRSARSLSGGETQRVNLTSCLGASLTDTLFALDEPTIGLHGTDINKLISILRALADAGNCVCVVEHDEQVINAADKVFEIGPLPGVKGGEISFEGTVTQLHQSQKSITGQWLSRNYLPEFLKNQKRKIQRTDPHLHIKNASCYNIKNLSARIPLSKLVCIAGVSGSGKSTLVHDIIYSGMVNPSKAKDVTSDISFEEVVVIDQSSVVRSPRSNPVLYSDAWSPIKEAFGRTESAKRLGFSANDFSFNAGNGRCDICSGLGYEIVEMQFLSDVQIPCSYCHGKRFKDEILIVQLDGLNVLETLNLTIEEAVIRFDHFPKTKRKLSALKKVGLGYLTLGQPLNTLSGGESQRLKLVKYMTTLKKEHFSSLLIIDEPTTGLHLEDIKQLMQSLQDIVESGHSLLIVEHHSHVLAQADWILEMGPGSGKNGGQLIASEPPSKLAKLKTPTATILKKKNQHVEKNIHEKRLTRDETFNTLEIEGARENNLQNISLEIPTNQFVVITGPSGSGKSSLAFDVIFAEGQRRFMESMSSYARQFVEQLGKPAVDRISGISPTVAIEQRVTRGTKKSTVGSITEVAQFLRLLYARVGTQLSVTDGNPLSIASESEISHQIEKIIRLRKPTSKSPLCLLAPLITSRKGHHKPVVNWARDKGYDFVRCDGQFFETIGFEGLDRYRLHDVEVLLEKWTSIPDRGMIRQSVRNSLQIGSGRSLLASMNGETSIWYSTSRVDSSNGESYPTLEPSLLSWNSARGWCTFCKGYGKIYQWMKDDLPATGKWWKMEDGETCTECKGERLNLISRNVVLYGAKKKKLSFPHLLQLTPEEIIVFLKSVQLSERLETVAHAIIPEIIERLQFMKKVGLDYLSLNRETSSLSGGEAQRIRLAAQLGSNLSGVLYVLDEPSIGLHPKDNQKLLRSLRDLQKRGNSLLVVEHDPETISQADFLIDIGPEAGHNGGKIIGLGKPAEVAKIKGSSTAEYMRDGIKHPIRGKWRKLPSKSKAALNDNWLKIKKVNFRNLKNFSIDIPAARLSICCGVSGSGKSSLVRGFLYQAVKSAILEKSANLKLDNGTILNGDIFNKAIEVTQSPIGKTPRSTPATYLGVWDRIRTMISSLPESKAKGFPPSHFSFNVKGGRCEVCKGAGRIKVEMSFLPNSYIQCSECNGKRYKEEILGLYWNTKNISEILDFTFEEAADFFKFDHFLFETFSLMIETGLGYIKLGQISPTLSGGEAQRLKLAAELALGLDKQKHRKLSKIKPTLYILEEPTIGLHTLDCKKLILLLHRLVEEGNTVIVIEHDTDVIAEADFIFELGPTGGKNGGELLYKGITSGILNSPKSLTSPFLKKVLS